MACERSVLLAPFIIEGVHIEELAEKLGDPWMPLSLI